MDFIESVHDDTVDHAVQMEHDSEENVEFIMSSGFCIVNFMRNVDYLLNSRQAYKLIV